MNLSETAKGILRSVAPVPASFFGTPLAGLAVKSVLDRWLGGEPGKPLDAKQVERALSQLTPSRRWPCNARIRSSRCRWRT